MHIHFHLSVKHFIQCLICSSHLGIRVTYGLTFLSEKTRKAQLFYRPKLEPWSPHLEDKSVDHNTTHAVYNCAITYASMNFFS